VKGSGTCSGRQGTHSVTVLVERYAWDEDEIQIRSGLIHG
jgi:hypothetical protein